MVCLTFLFCSHAYSLDIENGFVEYKWGDSSTKHAGLKILGEKEDISYYSKPEESYTIGNVTIDEVIYGFYKDQLFGVYLNIDSIEVYDTLLAHMKSLYGLPATKLTADNLSVLKWKQKDVTIKLKLDEPAQKMKLSFYYRPLSRELNAKDWEELDTSTFRFVPIEKDKKPEKFILFEF